MLALVLSFVATVLAQAKDLKIEELGTDNWAELIAFIYHSFTRIFGAYLPSGGQMVFGAIVAFGVLYMSAKKRHPKEKRSSSHSR